jgi:orotidine-5'-phosphate decarboxylase
MKRTFRALLEKAWDERKYMCVGLDTDLQRIPESVGGASVRETLVKFNRAIIEQTAHVAAAYKPNAAFYEAHGEEGAAALRETVFYIREVAPDAAIIYDAKRGDIENTNEHYATASFDRLNVDAITVEPYAGGASLEPFLRHEDKGVIVWCRSSNPGAGEFQDLLIDGKPLYLHVAEAAALWNTRGNCAVVVGATYPRELAMVRAAVGEMPILIPGVGAQDGNLKATIQNGKDNAGRGIIVNASRSILYASSGSDFAEAARKKAEELHQAVLAALEA